MSLFIKKNIIIIGILLCMIVLFMNTFWVATLDISEKISIRLYNIIEVGITALILIGILKLSNILDNKFGGIEKSKRILSFIVILMVYIIIQFVWIDMRKAIPLYDQEYVYRAAVNLAENNTKDIADYVQWYLSVYPHQLTLAYAESVLFKIFNTTNPLLLQYANAIANALTIMSVLLVSKQINKANEAKRVKTLIISILFVTLPLLSTFIYGDLMSIMMCMFAVYFIMKYEENKKVAYLIVSSLFMATACILRMNSIIYGIAILIYMILNVNNNIKRVITHFFVLVMFVIISIAPVLLINKMMKEKLKINDRYNLPTIVHLSIGMEADSYKGNGWYNTEYADNARNMGKKSKEIYTQFVINRLNYFNKEPIECIKFYSSKFVSMWAENTYAAIFYNYLSDSGMVIYKDKEEYDKIPKYGLDAIMDKLDKPVYILQKAIVLIIFGTTVIVLIKHKKNISNEIVLLVTIFIGGFLFQAIWEAKSRYVIPYIVVLMPMVSIGIDEEFREIICKVKEKIKKYICLFNA